MKKMSDKNRTKKITESVNRFFRHERRTEYQEADTIAQELLNEHGVWIVRQLERVQELETFIDESSKKHAELNVFLQRRKKTAKYLGKHVVNAVMEYVQDLESRVADDGHYIVEIIDENKRYREALEEIKRATSHNKYWKYIAFKALEESE